MEGSSLKPKFRARKLDNSRPLAVLRYDLLDHTNLDEFDSRSVPTVVTGVDKEEEIEVHLQTAITAAQVGAERVVIPTPVSNVLIDDYEQIYDKVTTRNILSCPASTKDYVKISTASLDDKTRRIGKYNAVFETDLNLLNQLGVQPAIYELIADCFAESAAKFGSKAVVGVESIENLRCDRELHHLLPPDDVVSVLAEHWKALPHPTLRLEDAPAEKIGSDPYVCFRRRHLRNHVRKTRRSDAQIADKIRRLHYDFECSRYLMKLCLRRDRLGQESVRLEGRLFEAYTKLEQAKKHISLEALAAARDTTLPAIPPFKIVGQPSITHRPFQTRKQKRQRMESAPPPVKISIPTSAFKTSISHPIPPRFSRPYYHPEVMKSITRDIEALLAADTTRSLPSIPSVETNQDVLALASLLGMFGGMTPFVSEQQPYRWSRPSFGNHSIRLGRSNRIIMDPVTTTTTTKHGASFVSKKNQINGFDSLLMAMNTSIPTASDRTSDSFSLFHASADNPTPHHTLPALRILPPRDCAQMNVASIGNINQHYLQCTANVRLTSPMTLLDWIAATNGLLQHTAANVRRSPVKHKKNPNSSAGPSPKRRKEASTHDVTYNCNPRE